jgi:hypothetical protein
MGNDRGTEGIRYAATPLAIATSVVKRHTWYNIFGVHSVFILDEAKAIHELDFLDGTGAMMAEMLLNVGFGD